MKGDDDMKRMEQRIREALRNWEKDDENREESSIATIFLIDEILIQETKGGGELKS
jgi:uncharacterized protein YbcI